eukprot:CAMPEP_0194356174 /NCGR_PEP_ID=MMETSP0174-20130528/3918_1 /TAXON_ID=216777 /ORGANISM="Proboscia alata, Strain PI-D3" /LENGTH=487 /DNA_ID=CAMNT_0039125689 /DNA_START=65 /DNA_END=1528 /DNA_ORIENTATION=+
MTINDLHDNESADRLYNPQKMYTSNSSMGASYMSAFFRQAKASTKPNLADDQTIFSAVFGSKKGQLVQPTRQKIIRKEISADESSWESDSESSSDESTTASSMVYSTSICDSSLHEEAGNPFYRSLETEYAKLKSEIAQLRSQEATQIQQNKQWARDVTKLESYLEKSTKETSASEKAKLELEQEYNVMQAKMNTSTELCENRQTSLEEMTILHDTVKEEASNIAREMEQINNYEKEMGGIMQDIKGDDKKAALEKIEVKEVIDRVTQNRDSLKKLADEVTNPRDDLISRRHRLRTERDSLQQQVERADNHSTILLSDLEELIAFKNSLETKNILQRTFFLNNPKNIPRASQIHVFVKEHTNNSKSTAETFPCANSADKSEASLVPLDMCDGFGDERIDGTPSKTISNDYSMCDDAIDIVSIDQYRAMTSSVIDKAHEEVPKERTAVPGKRFSLIAMFRRERKEYRGSLAPDEKNEPTKNWTLDLSQ